MPLEIILWDNKDTTRNNSDNNEIIKPHTSNIVKIIEKNP